MGYQQFSHLGVREISGHRLRRRSIYLDRCVYYTSRLDTPFQNGKRGWMRFEDHVLESVGRLFPLELNLIQVAHVQTYCN
jgi:hypothetical protein